jgi:hypothetical protein
MIAHRKITAAEIAASLAAWYAWKDVSVLTPHAGSTSIFHRHAKDGELATSRFGYVPQEALVQRPVASEGESESALAWAWAWAWASVWALRVEACPQRYVGSEGHS